MEFLLVLYTYIYLHIHTCSCLMLHLNISALSEQLLFLLPKNKLHVVERDEFIESDTSDFES